MGAVKTYNRQLSKDEAVWQYLLDHAKKVPGGKYRIFFYVHNRSQWDNKIRERMCGIYRNEEKDLESEYFGFKAQYRKDKEALANHREESDRKARTHDRIKKHGTLKERFILWLYQKTRNYLRKKG